MSAASPLPILISGSSASFLSILCVKSLHDRNIVSIILNRVVAFNPCGSFAGKSTKSPTFATIGFPDHNLRPAFQKIN